MAVVARTTARPRAQRPAREAGRFAWAESNPRTEVAQRSLMPASAHRSKVFLISPATAHGPRALSLRRPGSSSALARRLRAEGVPLGDVFSVLSGLYFRGKLEYARAFAHVPGEETGGVH